MKKFDIISSDCPWNFSDKITMSDVKRGAGSNYPELDIKEIKKLPVKFLAKDNCILALWVPSTHLQEGLDVMKAWGFSHKQTHIWVKTKKNPLESLINSVFIPKNNKFENIFTQSEVFDFINEQIDSLNDSIIKFDLNKILAFGLGRLFRQSHELLLIGTRGNVYKNLENRSQRSVHFGPVTKHSAKPEDLQDRLEIMFPDFKDKLELFARRKRQGWVCLGNESPESFGEDIRDSLKKIISNEDYSKYESELLINDLNVKALVKIIEDSGHILTKDFKKNILKNLK